MRLYTGTIMSVTEFLSNFEHLAQEKVIDLKWTMDQKIRPCLRDEVFKSVRYEDLLKNVVRFQWIQYLSEIKADKLTQQEFNIGMTTFEILYR